MTKHLSRRAFVKTGAVASAAVFASTAPRVHAGENNLLRIGMVGCSGRGRGAVLNAFEADPNCKLVAVGDVLPDRTQKTVELFNKVKPDRVDIKPDHVFVGLDCCKNVAQACDVVFSVEIPAFRPWTLKAAVEAGKHIFAEKPAAVDALGVKVAQAACDEAKKKKLNLVSGLCWRYDPELQEIMKRIHDGLIGDVVTVRECLLTQHGFKRPVAQGDTAMQREIRAWYNLRWLSGDFIVEQTVHAIDKGLWALGDKFQPLSAFGVGGRMSRTAQPDRGDIYDSMGVGYNMAEGRTMNTFCRQQQNCWYEYDGYVVGTKGYTNTVGKTVVMCDLNGKVLFEQKRLRLKSSYVEEQRALFTAIRSGGAMYINNGDYMCRATMAAILGRQAVYSGNLLTWEEAMQTGGIDLSKLNLNSEPPIQPDEKGRFKIPVPGLGEVWHTVVR